MTDKSLIVKSNKLIEARYSLTLNEQKIILYAVSKLDRDKKDFNILEFKVGEFTDLIGTTRKRYSEIREIVRGLRKKEIVIKSDKGEIITGWLSSIEYIKDTGKIELEFSQKLTPYLLQLEEMFTKYELKNILYLKNKYAIRIYELLKQYEKLSKREFKIEELKELIGCKGKYEDYRNFKNKVLDPSKEELNEYTDIVFEYEKITEGRRVIGIRFIIKSKSGKHSLAENLYSKEDLIELKKLCGLSDSNLNIDQVIKVYEVAVKKTENSTIDVHEYIRANYKYSLEKASNKGLYSYFLKAVQGDFANILIQMRMKNII